MIDVENQLERARSELKLGIGSMEVPEAPSIERRHLRRRALAFGTWIVLLVGVVSLSTSMLSNTTETDRVAGPPETQTEIITPPEPEPAPPVTAPIIVGDITHLVDSVEASSQMSDVFGAGNLIDGDLRTSWQATAEGGAGKRITFLFSAPVVITEIIVSPLQDEEQFLRNFWVQGYEILTDDPASRTSGRFTRTIDPQRILMDQATTTSLTFSVTATYPSEPVGGRPPFDELAVAQIQIIGYPLDPESAQTASQNPDLTLHVSNQSSAEPSIDITVLIDDEEVVADTFDVEGQHNWIQFDVDLEPGTHELVATSTTGALLIISLEIAEDRPIYAVIDYWSAEDETPPVSDAPYFTFTQSNEPIGFR